MSPDSPVPGDQVATDEPRGALPEDDGDQAAAESRPQDGGNG